MPVEVQHRITVQLFESLVFESWDKSLNFVSSTRVYRVSHLIFPHMLFHSSLHEKVRVTKFEELPAHPCVVFNHLARKCCTYILVLVRLFKKSCEGFREYQNTIKSCAHAKELSRKYYEIVEYCLLCFISSNGIHVHVFTLSFLYDLVFGPDDLLTCTGRQGVSICCIFESIYDQVIQGERISIQLVHCTNRSFFFESGGTLVVDHLSLVYEATRDDE